MKPGDSVYYHATPWARTQVVKLEKIVDGEAWITLSGVANSLTIIVPSYTLSPIPGRTTASIVAAKVKNETR